MSLHLTRIHVRIEQWDLGLYINFSPHSLKLSRRLMCHCELMDIVTVSGITTPYLSYFNCVQNPHYGTFHHLLSCFMFILKDILFKKIYAKRSTMILLSWISHITCKSKRNLYRWNSEIWIVEKNKSHLHLVFIGIDVDEVLYITIHFRTPLINEVQ